MKLAWPICHFIGGYGDLLQKVEVLEHPKNETGLANLYLFWVPKWIQMGVKNEK